MKKGFKVKMQFPIGNLTSAEFSFQTSIYVFHNLWKNVNEFAFCTL